MDGIIDLNLRIHVYPANTKRRNNVVLTSMRRHGVASTLIRHCFDVLFQLGTHFNVYKQRLFMLHTSWTEPANGINNISAFRRESRLSHLACNIDLCYLIPR